ncbi:MAG: Ribosomal small subunit methyltransferase [Actinomycetota bacterium]|jgi:16S rRNA (guanine527-N7)-methyltransferase
MSDVSHETLLIQRWPDAAENLRKFHNFLCTAGVDRGLLGPREIPRMWSRHIANSVVIESLIPKNATVVDVGSGAGLPGIPLAIVRPDLKVTLLEPLSRRVSFLEEAVAELNLSQVSVLRARAEDVKDQQWDVVTGRAVANLSKFLKLTWKLVSPNGQLLPLKGEQAATELQEAQGFLTKRHLTGKVLQVGADLINPATTVIQIRQA